MQRVTLVLASFICVLATAACGGNSYGNGSDFSKLKGNGSVAIQDPSPSPGAAASLGSNVPGGGGGSTGPTPQKSTAPPPPAAAHFPISITLDSPYFNPPASQVYAGTIITFTNKDSVARTVVSDSGDPASFNSGPIAPGASWSYTASVVGTFNYSDGTRPYTPASFKVLPKP